MFKHLTGDKWLGLTAVIAALLLIFVWVPLDIDTGLVEKVRRQIRLGDSLGPVTAGVVILLGGILTWMRPSADPQSLSVDNLKWMATLAVTIGVAFIVMRFAGPLITSLFTDTPYRALRATPPWNYIGYIAGGALLVVTLISLARRKVSLSAALVGIIASLVFALLYDLPFDDLQLPPNGDV